MSRIAKDRRKMTAKAIQNCSTVKVLSMKLMPKYVARKLTGMNSMVTFARRIVMRVSRSTYDSSLMAMRLKF